MENTQIILTIILLIVELVAFAWLILDIQKSKKKQDKILDLERQILEMEKSIMEIENNIILEIADLKELVKKIT
jgi:predicted subunit of tRNA(5-methylaminomethyl-2-thiouridylate) methyltransferase